MAMNNSGSGPDEWGQLYHRTLAGQPMVAPPRVLSMFGQTPAVSEAIVVTTVASASTIGPVPTGFTGPGTSTSTRLSEGEEGLSGRPIRRRTRPTRRAPTTVLNTDLSNFRAMVQQFTGVPTTPLSSAFKVERPTGNFGFDQSRCGVDTIVQPSFPQYYFHHQLQQQVHRQQQQQLQRGEGVYSMGQIDGAFLSGFNDPRSNMEVSDDCFASLSSQNSHRGGGFIE